MKKIIILLLTAVFAGGLSNTLSAAKVYFIFAPIPGIYYSTPIPLPNPGVPPYVERGDVIKEGETVCIIEAMLLCSEIVCPFKNCKILDILQENGYPVEQDEPLFHVDQWK